MQQPRKLNHDAIARLFISKSGRQQHLMHYIATNTMRALLRRRTLLYASPRSAVAATQSVGHVARHQSTSADIGKPATAALSPRWLSDVKARIGKCIMWGIDPDQTQEAGSILQETATNWRELVAGSEGFLTGKQWRGLYRQEVVWGEMVASTSSGVAQRLIRHLGYG
ncbi:hypothetical protein BKA63DRAFT_20389 [Paraphoma chrysanthemicola]|nr:hypothetical protein BKA63DRAFT_20389 [Paraphoma chrysanthemicola]